MKCICDICGAPYDTPEQAESCEARHGKDARKRKFLCDQPAKYRVGDLVKDVDGSVGVVLDIWPTHDEDGLLSLKPLRYVG